MKKKEWEVERDYDEVFNDDESLFFWMENKLFEDAVVDWFNEQPIYRETFLRFCRQNKKLMDKWKDHCAEVANEEDCEI